MSPMCLELFWVGPEVTNLHAMVEHKMTQKRQGTNSKETQNMSRGNK